MEPVGAQEIARMTGVNVETVYQWEQRGLLPPCLPSVRVSGRRVWTRARIEKWANQTGRAIVAGPYETEVES